MLGVIRVHRTVEERTEWSQAAFSSLGNVLSYAQPICHTNRVTGPAQIPFWGDWPCSVNKQLKDLKCWWGPPGPCTSRSEATEDRGNLSAVWYAMSHPVWDWLSSKENSEVCPSRDWLSWGRLNCGCKLVHKPRLKFTYWIYKQQKGFLRFAKGMFFFNLSDGYAILLSRGSLEGNHKKKQQQPTWNLAWTNGKSNTEQTNKTGSR